jgi:hypothetical protein
VSGKAPAGALPDRTHTTQSGSGFLDDRHTGVEERRSEPLAFLPAFLRPILGRSHATATVGNRRGRQ